MHFRKFLLDNYISTPDGRASLTFFENLPDYVRSGDSKGRIKKFVDDLLLTPMASLWYEPDCLSNFEPVAYRNFDEFADETIVELKDVLVEK